MSTSNSLCRSLAILLVWLFITRSNCLFQSCDIIFKMHKYRKYEKLCRISSQIKASSLFSAVFCPVFKLSCSVTTLEVNFFDDSDHLLDFVESTLGNVGVRSKDLHSCKNSIAPAQLICFVLQSSNLLNKCSLFSRFKIRIRLID